MIEKANRNFINKSKHGAGAEQKKTGAARRRPGGRFQKLF